MAVVPNGDVPAAVSEPAPNNPSQVVAAVATVKDLFKLKLKRKIKLQNVTCHAFIGIPKTKMDENSIFWKLSLLFNLRDWWIAGAFVVNTGQSSGFAWAIGRAVTIEGTKSALK